MAKARPQPPEPSPLRLTTTKEFRRDLKRCQKRGKDLSKLHALLEALRHRRRLAARHRDHSLAGEWNGWRDCHIEPDWLLIYRQTDDELLLARTGRHSDLFDE